MNLRTETVLRAMPEKGLLFDNLARTDPEFFSNLRRSQIISERGDTIVKPAERLVSSTAPEDRHEGFDQRIRTLFKTAKEESFEDGMESQFSKALMDLVKKYGNAAVGVISQLIIDEMVHDEVASEALRWLGRINHPLSYRARLQLLERSLSCSSARVRDGAALGLASLDDPHAMTYLKQAIERERHAALKDDMKQVLTQLEGTRQCRLF